MSAGGERRRGRGRYQRGGAGWRGHRGPRARRGDVRTALLVLLAEEPRNGYQLMQEIEQRSGGAWRPSPGSVYPTLQQLEDEGLVSTQERDGQRVYDLTDAGRARVDERPADAPAPWDELGQGAGSERRQLLGLVREIGMAAAQVAHAGDDSQVAQAKEILSEVRRSLYRILAEEPAGDDTPSSA
jgi:DNA-binding PadR family transcriptional regulator